MDDHTSDKLTELLVEIRDLQREALAEYKSVTNRSLELQQKAVNRQEDLGRLYRRVVFGGIPLIFALVFLLIYLVGKIT